MSLSAAGSRTPLGPENHRLARKGVDSHQGAAFDDVRLVCRRHPEPHFPEGLLISGQRKSDRQLSRGHRLAWNAEGPNREPGGPLPANDWRGEVEPQSPARPSAPTLMQKRGVATGPPTALWAADLSPATLPGPEDRAPFPPTDRSTLTPDRLSPVYSRREGRRITDPGASSGGSGAGP